MQKYVLIIFGLLFVETAAFADVEFNCDFENAGDLSFWNPMGYEGVCSGYIPSPNFSFGWVYLPNSSTWVADVTTWNYMSPFHDRALALLERPEVLTAELQRVELDILCFSVSGNYAYWNFYFCSQGAEDFFDSYCLVLAIRPDYRRVELHKYVDGEVGLLGWMDADLSLMGLYRVFVDMGIRTVKVTGTGVDVTLPIDDEGEWYTKGTIGFGVYSAGLETVRGGFDNVTAFWDMRDESSSQASSWSALKSLF